MKLLKVDTVEETKNKMEHHFRKHFLEEIEIDTNKSLGRVLAEDIYAPFDLPEFHRSTVDGYAIWSKDTFGASDSLPVFLNYVGMVDMGVDTNLSVSTGKAVYVPTGAMIPNGADGVVMIEYVELLDSHTIAVHRSVAPGDGMVLKGEDLKKDSLILKKGRRLKPQDIGALAAVGIKHIKVLEKPRVAILSTGDEIVSPDEEVPFGKIRDINTYTISAMAEQMGCEVTFKAVVKDDYHLLIKILEPLVKENQIVIISGGSSVGTKDVTAKVIDDLGEPGMFVHGVAVKPGKPTIIGKAGNAALFGLPGHPVSAMIVFKIFVEYLIHDIMKYEIEKNIVLQALADTNIHSSPGKETYQMVIIEKSGEDYIAKAIHGKSGAISLMTRAQGYIKIDTNKEGVKKGEKVDVYLL